MTREEKEIALYCLKASSDYHPEVCEECVKYPNCDHTIQDDVTETIIKALEEEPCEYAVSRQALYEWLDGWKKKNKYYHPHTKNKIIPICEVIDIIQSLPPVTPTRKKGKWILLNEESNTWGCTHCKELGKDDWWKLNSGTPKDNKMDFCPHCGAEMESD